MSDDKKPPPPPKQPPPPPKNPGEPHNVQSSTQPPRKTVLGVNRGKGAKK